MSDKPQNIYFISDLHLGAAYITDHRRHERDIVRFLDSIKSDAAELYMLGDILDYWYEYRTVVPRGYIRFFGKLAELADSGVRITWLIGNHDIWIFDYLPTEIGLTVIDGDIRRTFGGKNFYMAHGDALGSLKPGFRFIRAVFRNHFCQRLYSAIHPRWTIPFAHRWSRHSRTSEQGQYEEYMGDDSEPSMLFARQYIAANPEIDFIILGHRHIVLDKSIPPHCRLIILGDWINRQTYAKWDGQQLSLHDFRSNFPQ